MHPGLQRRKARAHGRGPAAYLSRDRRHGRPGLGL